ncbi:MAG: threonine synthase, partial [Bacteroidota bacterium]
TKIKSMIKFVSIKGGITPVDFETAILDGFAADGGLYVPERLPKIDVETLASWKGLNYQEVAFEVLSLFIDSSVISSTELKQLLNDSFSSFYHPDLIPIYPLKSRKGIFIQELFHGPTLSFKDVAMGFVVNLFNFFLKKRGQKMSIVVATTGDTGPAAAHASVGKETLNTWVLYPKELITEEQERQMTTLFAANVHPVGVYNCPDGADDLDLLIAELFADTEFKKQLNLSSVNSINWGRVMMQTVHYFYGYLQLVDRVGELVNFAVPSGAFGNLCAGSLARLMGLPVGKFIIANNQNACLTRIFTEGLFEKRPIIGCPSSAIDILIPYNFWRYLYFAVGQDSTKIKAWIAAFEETGKVQFDSTSFQQYSRGYLAHSVSDKATLKTIQSVFEAENYLLDPHAAVAVAAADKMAERLEVGSKTLCLATAHPCKFPESIRAALSVADSPLPKAATHPSVEKAKQLCQKGYHVDYSTMRTGIRASMLASVR